MKHLTETVTTRTARIAAGLCAICLTALAGATTVRGEGPADCDVVAPDPAASECHDLYVSPHLDDDLIFMSPDLLHSIQAGHTVRTIYVTAGDALALGTKLWALGYYPEAGICDSQNPGGTCAYWDARERGIREAYAKMANVADIWTYDTPQAGVHRFTLDGAPQISLVFLRLPDGPALWKLWAGLRSTGDIFFETSEHGQSFYPDGFVPPKPRFYKTSNNLAALLRSQMNSFRADRVRTMDNTNLYPVPLGDLLDGAADHTDHYHTGLFAMAARAGYRRPHTLELYRGYNTKAEPENVGNADYTPKYDAFRTYAVHDIGTHCGKVWPQDPPFTDCDDFYRDGSSTNWLRRQYKIVPVAGTGLILSYKGGVQYCLEADGVPDSPVRVESCHTFSSRWTLSADQIIDVASGLCLATGKRDYRLIVQDCKKNRRQKWNLFTNQQIRGPITECVEWEDFAIFLPAPDQFLRVHALPCRATERQKWELFQ